MNKADAKKLTDRIRAAVDDLWALLLEAHERKAWTALGHATWEAYVKAEFGMTRQRSYQILDQGRVIEAVRDVTGNLSNAFDISARDTAAVKGDLPAVTREIKARIDKGEAPAKAAADVVDEKRAEKERIAEDRKAQQAEFDRQRIAAQDALPQAVKSQVAAVKQATAKKKKAPVAFGLSADEQVAELQEAVRVLENEAQTLRAENAKFSDMWVQYQKGGFEAVIAGKDEEIRVLKTRVYRESEDKAGWAKVSKFWRKQAVKLGYSSDAVIPVEPTSDEVITLDV
ncbi:hypothetical protein [Mesorhizobium sp. M0870]|uniref:hypothetical protein n=1 Tax=Mesorhizobium sp. M0870 TaxID=2957016 RepID=UPI003336F752